MRKIDRFDIQRRVVSHMVMTLWQNVPHEVLKRYCSSL